MLPSSVHRSDQGFTLIESLIIVLVIGILAAIAAPSFLATLNRSRVNDGLALVEGALKEAQREAIKKSKNCTVNIASGNNSTLTATPVDCLITGSRELKDVTIRRNLSSITFNFKGGRTGSTGTVVVTLPSGAIQQKCLVIAPGIGIMRTGNYSDDDTTGASADNCTTPQ